jgi:Phage integrase family
MSSSEDEILLRAGGSLKSTFETAKNAGRQVSIQLLTIGSGAGTGRPSPRRNLGAETVGEHLRTALTKCKLPETLSLYQVTRHTYASKFTAADGSIQKLQAILGHTSVTTTERYSHLAPEHLRPAYLPALTVDLSRAGAVVVDLAAHRESAPDHGVTIEAVDEERRDSVSSDSH